MHYPGFSPVLIWLRKRLIDRRNEDICPFLFGFSRDFSFICREGKWSLAPAYDLTLCKEGYHGEHATSANNKGNPDIEDMLAVGESIRIPRRKGMEIINHMINHCQEILSTRFE